MSVLEMEKEFSQLIKQANSRQLSLVLRILKSLVNG